MTNVHASAVTPFALLLVHISWWTFGLVVATAIGVAILSIKGRSVVWLLRKLKCTLRGKRLASRPLWYRRRVNRLQSHTELSIETLRGEPA